MSNLGKVIFLFVPGPLGGAEKIVAYGIKALVAQGLNAHLWIIKEERVPHVTDAFISLLDSEDIPYKVFSSHGIFDRSLLRELKLNFKKESPSLIHTHGFKAAFYGKLSKNAQSRFIVTHHGKTGHTLKVKIYEFIELQVMKRAEGVVAVSEDMKRMLIENGVNAVKVHVVENFMTTHFMEKLARPGADKKRYLFVGRLSPEKGCDVLLTGLPKKSELTIVGDGVERASLESMAKNLPVKFLGFRKDISELMVNHDVLVMPSYREGQPLTLIEACCLGMPVLASNVGGIPELVTHGMNGLLFEAGNQNDLRKKFELMDSSFESLNKNAEDKKLDFRIRFSSEKWARRSEEIYLRVSSQL